MPIHLITTKQHRHFYISRIAHLPIARLRKSWVRNFVLILKHPLEVDSHKHCGRNQTVTTNTEVSSDDVFYGDPINVVNQTSLFSQVFVQQQHSFFLRETVECTIIFLLAYAAKPSRQSKDRRSALVRAVWVLLSSRRLFIIHC